MIYDIIFNIVASIILIYILFLLCSLIFNSIFAFKNKKILQELKSEDRLEEIEKIKRDYSKYTSWLISKRILLSCFTFADYKKTVIESQEGKEKPLSKKPGVDSIIFSIFILMFTFLIIGSSINTDLFMMEILTNTIRLISVVIGLFLIFRNIQINYLQFKNNNKLLTLFAMLFNVLSIFYFGFVTFHTIIEIFG